MNYEYISFSMKEGIEELEKIIALADNKTLTEDVFKVRLYAMLLDVFQGFNLRKSAMRKEDFDGADVPPQEIMKLFE